MEPYTDDPNKLKNVPTGMETDPEADEQVIDQTGDNDQTGAEANRPDDINPSGIEKPEAGNETPMDDLANALAYAIDGSGTGVAGAPPVAPVEGEEQKVKTEGITGAGHDDEERNLAG
ncbi:hypothetical protein FAES_2082 [Fibrella aestuarina BUZ 2]|uniref:Uncharacterized protein n=1 Tax=Fibrella aestuarina BUZ 2 TaxID=1166018 RepID=I0K7I8_9BACT|nr:hypothetical protein [Fibrella aestuarina]CCH00091.1 hypothetical protein FAES_2082 [Fibrella aestuarina BUZ 2]